MNPSAKVILPRAPNSSSPPPEEEPPPDVLEFTILASRKSPSSGSSKYDSSTFTSLLHESRTTRTDSPTLGSKDSSDDFWLLFPVGPSERPLKKRGPSQCEALRGGTLTPSPKLDSSYNDGEAVLVTL